MICSFYQFSMSLLKKTISINLFLRTLKIFDSVTVRLLPDGTKSWTNIVYIQSIGIKMYLVYSKTYFVNLICRKV